MKFANSTLSVLAFYSSLAPLPQAFAGSPDLDCDCEITIPKYVGGVNVSVEALYFAVDVKNTEYAIGFQNQSGVATFRSHNPDTDNAWGLSVGLGYAVAGTGNDFQLNWTDISWSFSETKQAVAGSSATLHTFIPNESPFFTSATDPMVESVSVKGAHEVSYQKMDLEAGQMLKIGRDSVTLRAHAGLRYAEFDTALKVHYTPVELEFFEDISGAYRAEANWEGVGPRFGIDGAWHLGNGFAIVANISAAVLVGDASASQTNETQGEFIQQGPPPDSAVMSRVFGNPDLEVGNEAGRTSHAHKIVPVLEGRLGLSYNHVYPNHSELILASGYQVSHYFDVDTKFDPAGTDIGFSGLYAQLTVVL